MEVLPTVPTAVPPADRVDDTSNPTLVTVKLITATRFPARHSRLVRANVEGPEITTKTCLFQPKLDNPEFPGLSIANAVMELNKEITLLVDNYSSESVYLRDRYLET